MSNEAGIREYLTTYRWPKGLQDALIKELPRYPARYFICDDSGSMNAIDGEMLVSSGTQYKMVECTRWKELTTAMKFHVGLAQAASALSEFRLLNNAPPITIGINDPNAYPAALDAFERSPTGATPLCFHVKQVISQIQSFEPQLRANGHKACVIICTDGEPSDGDIVAAMKPLCTLPAWVVVRMCTGEESIVNYWENIDKSLELNMDIMDDIKGEAEGVFNQNSWLTYGEPIQRLREFGFTIKEFDLLDELPLSLDQIRTVVAIM